MIHTVTLNPAVDRILYLPALQKNVTNRIHGIHDTIGGKGTHVSINLKLLGGENIPYGICYGSYGLDILRMLGEYGLTPSFIHKSEGNSRMNYLLVEDIGDCTLVVEKGAPLDPADFDDLLSRLIDSFADGDILVLSGDTSNTAPDAYPRIIRALAGKHPRVFLDTSGPALETCLGEAPFLVKPNLDELSYLCRRTVSADTSDILDALDGLSHYGVENFAVSLGGDGALLKTPRGVCRATPAPVEVKNTIGCGDCFLAGLLRGFSQGLSDGDTLRLAAAASSATAENPDSVGFATGRPDALINHVKVTTIS